MSINEAIKYHEEVIERLKELKLIKECSSDDVIDIKNYSDIELTHIFIDTDYK